MEVDSVSLMSNMKIQRQILLLAMVVGMGLSSVKGVLAAAPLRLYFNNSNFSIAVGEKKLIKLMADSGSEKVSGANLTIGYSDKIKVNSVTMSTVNFGSVAISKAVGGQILLYGYSSKAPTDLPHGQFEVATIEIEGVNAGAVSFNLAANQVVGVSAASQPFAVVLTNPTITVGAGNGIDGILKFKTTFAGVTTGARCTGSWSVAVSVLRGTMGKTYDNISLTPVGEYQGRIVYEGQVTLSGMSAGGNLSVFIKGPRHLQVKYGIDSQVEFYNQQGGQISVTASSATTPNHDFTKYPLMAGDVGGVSGIGQDGVVDGLDFSYVKKEVNKRSSGATMVADLNGNCQLESQDLSLLMLAMKDKQEQLY